jgi:hypothetical protein
MTLSHSTIGGGGAKSGTVATLQVEGTVGQSAPGLWTSSGLYQLEGGFWFDQTVQPTTPKASIAGRITDSNGRGVYRAFIALIDVSTGEIKRASTSAFGYFRFDQVETGRVYVIEPASKRYTFDPLSATLTLLDNVTDLNFSTVQQ